VVCYLAIGLPAVVGGLLVVHGGGLLATAREYGIAVIMLAGAAMTGTLFPLAKAQTLAASPVPRSPVC
jgi:hypothetical protein